LRRSFYPFGRCLSRLITHSPSAESKRECPSS
jgi:hypothetical protein